MGWPTQNCPFVIKDFNFNGRCFYHRNNWYVIITLKLTNKERKYDSRDIRTWLTICLFHVRFIYAADDNSQFALSGLTLKSKLLVELSKRTPPSDQWRTARDGTVVRALTSHQCDLGSNFGVDAICGPGGGSTQYTTNVYTGRLRPKVQLLTLLNTIFHEKGTPFVYLLLTNGTPFTYLV